MSNQIKDPQAAAAEDNTPTLTVTHYQELAAKVLAAVTTALEEIGPLVKSHPVTRGRIRAQAAVDTAFIATVVTAVKNTPELQQLGFDVAAVQDALQYIEAMTQVVQQLDVLAASVKSTVEARKAKAGREALHVYSVAKRYAQDADDRPNVLAQANLMRDALGRTQPKPRVQTPAPPLETGKEVPKAA